MGSPAFVSDRSPSVRSAQALCGFPVSEQETCLLAFAADLWESGLIDPTATPHADSGSAAAQLGELIKNARHDSRLSLRQVRDRTNISIGTLSQLENGKRVVAPRTLERIIDAVAADGSEAFRLAGAVPPQAASEVLGPELALALTGGAFSSDARQALRRVHLTELARGLTAGVYGAPVQVDTLLFAQLGIDHKPTNGIGWARFRGQGLIEYTPALDETEARVARNFMLAHMAGHALVARDGDRIPHCSHEAGGRPEGEATWLAGLVLMPRALLENEFQARATEYELSEQTGLIDLIRDVASGFGAPFWLAIRQVADAGLLAWAQGLEEL